MRRNYSIALALLVCTIIKLSFGFQPIARLSRTSSGDAVFRKKEIIKRIHSTPQNQQVDPWRNNNETPERLAPFNPFDYNASLKSRRQGSETTISLRQMAMAALNEKLFAANSVEERTHILKENQDMLLEPLVEDDAVLPLDSIYRQCTNQSERVAAFDANMTARIQTAKSASVKTILQEMKAFVLAHC